MDLLRLPTTVVEMTEKEGVCLNKRATIFADKQEVHRLGKMKSKILSFKIETRRFYILPTGLQEWTMISKPRRTTM